MNLAGECKFVSLLKLKNIRKEFPGCIANDNVDLDIDAGQIHALLGENGAGKSTLVKVIYGLLKPDFGQIIWNGEETDIISPLEARRLGIGMVFQHFSLFDALTVSENISLGITQTLKRSDLDDRISEISKSYGFSINPNREIFSLSVGERQRVEIVRCLLQKPLLLIMDEPTSVLTPQEAEKLFETLKRLSDEGCSILYISHRLQEIKRLCSMATILRAGKVVRNCDPSEVSTRELAEMMMGANINRPTRKKNTKSSSPSLEVTDLSINPKEAMGVSLREISLTVSGGEILGIAGLAGNGQSELMEQLSGETLANNAESIQLSGISVGKMGPLERREMGLCYIPEERMGHGAVPDLTLWENAFLSAMDRKKLSKGGFINIQKSRSFSESVVKRFKVKGGGVEQSASSLSGGNLQKYIVGREIAQDPIVLIALQPTWGVDAGSAAAIHKEIVNLAEKGTAVLIISQDLDELFLICDRIAVISQGRLSPPMPANGTTVGEIGLLMGGEPADQRSLEGDL